MQNVTSKKAQRLAGADVAKGEKRRIPSSHARLLEKQGLVDIERAPKLAPEEVAKRKAAKVAKKAKK